LKYSLLIITNRKRIKFSSHQPEIIIFYL